MNIMGAVVELGSGYVPADNFGNKAHNLNYLMQKGYCVPKGVAVSKDYFFKRDELDFPVLCDMLWNKLKNMNCLPAIVRSSACDENSGHSSYAGIYESIYPVNSRAELQMAITKVWDSYYSDQAVEYRSNTDHVNAGMALICQQWIDGDILAIQFWIIQTAFLLKRLLV